MFINLKREVSGFYKFAHKFSRTEEQLFKLSVYYKIVVYNECSTCTDNLSEKIFCKLYVYAYD